MTARARIVRLRGGVMEVFARGGYELPRHRRAPLRSRRNVAREAFLEGLGQPGFLAFLVCKTLERFAHHFACRVVSSALDLASNEGVKFGAELKAGTAGHENRPPRTW